jgi:peptidylprolyl isomerase
VRRLLAVCVLAGALALAGSSDDGGQADPTATSTEVPTATLAADVTVSDLDQVEANSAVGEDPNVSWGDGVFGVAETTRRILTEGDGAEVTTGQRLVVDYWAINGQNGNVYDSSTQGNPATFKLTDQLQPGIVKILDGVQVGARVLGAAAPADAFGPQGGNPDADIAGDDTILYVMDVREAVDVPNRASGEALTPEPGLPTVELADNGEPTITIPDAEPPGELVAETLIQGAGETVEAGQTLDVQYKGVIWGSGEEFDSSWSRDSSASFTIGEGAVIPGWDEGLVGKKVGSQVLLVIPPDKGYGEQGQPQASIAGTDTLVFVVDILDAY